MEYLASLFHDKEKEEESHKKMLNELVIEPLGFCRDIFLSCLRRNHLYADYFVFHYCELSCFSHILSVSTGVTWQHYSLFYHYYKYLCA